MGLCVDGDADAVHVLQMIIEKSAEWGEDLWITTLDVENVCTQANGHM